jgi:tetratricopeptide (TPR) repeat protein
MNYRDYHARATEASNHADKGEHHQAIAIFRALLDEDISDLDKATMSMNIAICCEHLKLPEDALAWYDAAIAIEEPYLRFQCTENKGNCLYRLGRTAEAIAIYERLITRPYRL